jgi:threonine dehydrogenase-like Zn-dependent dehydrogenase
MRGVVCDGRSIRYTEDLPEPRPATGEVILEVALAGICDTDIQLARGYMGFRGVLGHEFVGRTPDGRRVTAEINCSCHRCPTCCAGRPNHCPNRTVLGIARRDGAMADRVSVPVRNLHGIPDSIDDRTAVLIEPLAAAFRVLDEVPIGPGMRVAVVGDGKLGLLCTWVVRTTGAEVHLVGKHSAKLDLAGDGVATHRLEEKGLLEASFDVVIEASGSPSGLPTALGLVRPAGTIVLKTTIAALYQIDLAPIVIHEIRVVGSRCGPFPRAIEALVRGEVDVSPLIGASFPIEEAEAAFAAATAPGARKILLTLR